MYWGERDLGVVVVEVGYFTSMIASMVLELTSAVFTWRPKIILFSFCTPGYKMPSTGFSTQEKLSKDL